MKEINPPEKGFEPMSTCFTLNSHKCAIYDTQYSQRHHIYRKSPYILPGVLRELDDPIYA